MLEHEHHFWWDGGFESVHNRRNRMINPRETAHAASPFYRMDMSRRDFAITGLEAFPEQKRLQGLVLPAPEMPVKMEFSAEIDGKCYYLNPQQDSLKSVMVYDSGSVCHQLRMKGAGLYGQDGVLLQDVGLEITFYLWQDLISASFQLVEQEKRFPLQRSHMHMVVRINLEQPCCRRGAAEAAWVQLREGGFSVSTDSMMTLEPEALTFETSGNLIHTYWEAMRSQPSERLEKRMAGVQITLSNVDDGTKLETAFDPFSGGMKLEMDNTEDKSFRISASTEQDEKIPLRLMLSREGEAQMKPDGTIVPVTKQTKLAGASYAYGRTFRGVPSGTAWEICRGGHEFECFPRPYTQRWVHLYAQASCKKGEPYEEIVTVGPSVLQNLPVACFGQLSLLGWDDNPYYGNDEDLTAVQLWLQGLIGHQEILCLCSESHMTDSTITDIRPIDSRNSWGPNNGGGDFLRYHTAGDATLRKMLAARVTFASYGPLVSINNYHMNSEDNAIQGDIRMMIHSARDLARVYMAADYEVEKDMDVTDLTLAWLGCPGYDRSRYAMYAWGEGEQVCGNGLVEVKQGPGEEIVQQNVADNSWYAAYRGGIIDEQFREPNANKGLICRESKLQLAAHPDITLQAKRLRIDAFDGLTTQFWLGLYPDEGVLHLKRGDKLHIVAEYVPVVKFANDMRESEKAYHDLLRDWPDTYEPIRYEAFQGARSIKALQGRVLETQPVLRAEPVLTEIGAQGLFHVQYGTGYFPMEIQVPFAPAGVNVEFSNPDWKLAHSIPYQLDRQDDAWRITVVVQASTDRMALSGAGSDIKVTVFK